MKKLAMIMAVVGLVFSAGAMANTPASSTMWFQGNLTDAGGGVYTGEISMTEGYYYILGGLGYSSRNVAYQQSGNAEGGFDVYGRDGATAYSQYPGNALKSQTMDSDHDAYEAGSSLGQYTPNISDWDTYSLQLTPDHWYLWYNSSENQYTPMSGTMNWSTLVATESDFGTITGSIASDDPVDYGGGAAAWDWEMSWGIEVIPLEYPGFDVSMNDLGGGNFEVALTPTPEPATMSLLALGGLAVLKRRRRRRS